MGDIGDYGKYGLLRAVAASGLRLAVNWYRVIPPSPKKSQRPRPWDGRYTQYLERPGEYHPYDPALFDCLADLVPHARTLNALYTGRAGLSGIVFAG